MGMLRQHVASDVWIRPMIDDHEEDGDFRFVVDSIRYLLNNPLCEIRQTTLESLMLVFRELGKQSPSAAQTYQLSCDDADRKVRSLDEELVNTIYAVDEERDGMMIEECLLGMTAHERELISRAFSTRVDSSEICMLPYPLADLVEKSGQLSRRSTRGRPR